MSKVSALIRWSAQQHGVFTRGQAHDRGVSNKQIRRLTSVGEVEQFCGNVFVVPGVGDPVLKSMMSATASIPGSAVAGRSACFLHGMGEPSVSRVDLWIPERARHRTLEGVGLLRNAAVVAHRHVAPVNRIRTLSPPLALMQAGIWLDDEALEHCLDDFLRRFDQAWLRSELERFGRPGRPGIAGLRRVLNAPNRVMGVTDSWMERLLANLAAQPGLPPVQVQCEVVVGAVTYRVDVAFQSIRLGLEAHSRTFHFGPKKENADNVRDLAFASVGWQLLYLTWQQIHDPEAFAKQFGAIARRRARDLGLTY